MSVRQEENILSLAVHIEFRVMFQDMEIQCNEEIRAAQGTAGMP